MGRAKPIELATITFEKQGDATAFFSAMLNRYQVGETVNDADSLHLSALLVRHPDYKDKVGCGVDHFEVMRSPDHGTNCFRIVRTDKRGTDFSLGHCIKGEAPSKKQEVSQALRRVVRFDLKRAKEKFFADNKDEDGRVKCAITRELITFEDAHVDHRQPMTFEVLVVTFLEGRGLSFDDVALTESEDDQFSADLLDKELAKEFRLYHQHIAKIDIVKKCENLAASAKHRVRNTRISLLD